MIDFRKKNILFNKLEREFINYNIDENNLDPILLDLNIDKTDFYSLFPKKIEDLCYFYFFRTYHMSYKEVKKKILSEKSISIKTSLLLSVFIEIFGSKKRVSIFFLTYALLNPLLLSKIIYKISSKIWYDVGDKSIDFNYYSKRFILMNIIRNCLFYWRKTLDVDKTLNFANRQVIFFGKLGKIKFNAKKYISDKLNLNSI